MLCLSHQATLNMLDVVADGHDEFVWEWRENLLKRIAFSDIPVCSYNFILLKQYELF